MIFFFFQNLTVNRSLYNRDERRDIKHARESLLRFYARIIYSTILYDDEIQYILYYNIIITYYNIIFLLLLLIW